MIIQTGQGALAVAARPRDPYRQWTTLNADTFAGRDVTPEGALALTAVYGAVSLLSNACGTMPLEVIDERAVSGERVVRGGWLAPMLRSRPNEDMSGVDYWTLVFAHLLLRGNHYAAKIRDSAGTVRELWPIRPEYVTPFRDESGRKMFRVRIYEGIEYVDVPFTARDILHIKGPSFDDGLTGASPIAVVRNRMGVQLAQSEFQGRFYQDGMSVQGALKTAESLTPDRVEQLKRQWRQTYAGLENAHSVAVLHSGAEFQQISLSSKDAQFIETMRWGHTEVATVYGIPASELNGEGASLSYSNIGMDDLKFHKRACWPRLRQVEDSLNRDPDLFGFTSPWVPKFNADAHLRMDLKSRYEAYEIGLRNKFLTRNDVRLSEDMAPMEGGDEVTPDTPPPVPVAPAAVANPEGGGEGGSDDDS